MTGFLTEPREYKFEAVFIDDLALSDFCFDRRGECWHLLGEYVKRLQLDVPSKGSGSGMAPGGGGYVKAVLQGLVAEMRFLARLQAGGDTVVADYGLDDVDSLE